MLERQLSRRFKGKYNWANVLNNRYYSGQGDVSSYFKRYVIVYLDYNVSGKIAPAELDLCRSPWV